MEQYTLGSWAEHLEILGSHIVRENLPDADVVRGKIGLDTIILENNLLILIARMTDLYPPVETSALLKEAGDALTAVRRVRSNLKRERFLLYQTICLTAAQIAFFISLYKTLFPEGIPGTDDPVFHSTGLSYGMQTKDAGYKNPQGIGDSAILPGMEEE